MAPSSSTGIEEDSLEVIMANVEEMLEGYEWVNDTESLTGTKRKRTAADQVEARLQDELVALEKVISLILFSTYMVSIPTHP